MVNAPFPENLRARRAERSKYDTSGAAPGRASHIARRPHSTTGRALCGCVLKRRGARPIQSLAFLYEVVPRIMAAKHPTRPEINGEPASATSDTGRLRALMRTCPEIPEPVTRARIAFVNERLVDESLLRGITEHLGPGAPDEAQAARLERRRAAISPFVGRRLVCVLITLPGVRYTIEIDPSDERIVHWECQTS